MSKWIFLWNWFFRKSAARWRFNLEQQESNWIHKKLISASWVIDSPADSISDRGEFKTSHKTSVKKSKSFVHPSQEVEVSWDSPVTVLRIAFQTGSQISDIYCPHLERFGITSASFYDQPSHTHLFDAKGQKLQKCTAGHIWSWRKVKRPKKMKIWDF